MERHNPFMFQSTNQYLDMAKDSNHQMILPYQQPRPSSHRRLVDLSRFRSALAGLDLEVMANGLHVLLI
jgi:hypothetical protein